MNLTDTEKEGILTGTVILSSVVCHLNLSKFLSLLAALIEYDLH